MNSLLVLTLTGRIHFWRSRELNKMVKIIIPNQKQMEGLPILLRILRLSRTKRDHRALRQNEVGMLIEVAEEEAEEEAILEIEETEVVSEDEVVCAAGIIKVVTISSRVVLCETKTRVSN